MIFEIIEAHWSKNCSRIANCADATYLARCKQDSSLNNLFRTLKEAQAYIDEFKSSNI